LKCSVVMSPCHTVYRIEHNPYRTRIPMEIAPMADLKIATEDGAVRLHLCIAETERPEQSSSVIDTLAIGSASTTSVEL
jgi:hypothetical protein